MFGIGADICGAIVTQSSPHSHSEEHHYLKLPLFDKRTQVFIAIGKENRKRNFLSAEGFEPPLVTFPYQEAQYLETPWNVEAQGERNKKIVFHFLHKIAHVPSLTKYKHQFLDHIQSQPEPRTGNYIVSLIFIALIITILFLWKEKGRLAVLDTNNNNNMHLVPFSEGVIETMVTNRAEDVDAWISSIRSTYNVRSKPIVVGLDCEWKPNIVKLSVPNKAAVLQLCVDTKCLVIQLLYMDVPESVRSFLSDPNFIFVGVEVGRDIKKLSNEYGIGCTRYEDLRNLALTSGAYAFCYRYGLRNLASNVVGLEISKPAHACRSNWEARDLDEQQIHYATIDAYASYRIGHKLFTEMDMKKLP